MKNMYNIHKILIDLDDVCVDSSEMFGRLCPTIKDMESYLLTLKILGKKQEIVYDLILKAITKKLYLTAKPTLFVTALTDVLLPYWSSLGIQVEILSSIMSNNPLEKELSEQKLLWCKKYFPQLKVSLVPGSSLKQDFAKDRGVLLIDDYDRTISQFIKSGGVAIQYTTLNNTMKQLRLLHLTPEG